MWSDRQLGQGNGVRRTGRQGNWASVKAAKKPWNARRSASLAWSHSATHPRKAVGPLRSRVHALRETNKEKKVLGEGGGELTETFGGEPLRHNAAFGSQPCSPRSHQKYPAIQSLRFLALPGTGFEHQAWQKKKASAVHAERRQNPDCTTSKPITQTKSGGVESCSSVRDLRGSRPSVPKHAQAMENGPLLKRREQGCGLRGCGHDSHRAFSCRER